MLRFSFKRMLSELREANSNYLYLIAEKDYSVYDMPQELLNIIKKHASLVQLTDREKATYDTATTNTKYFMVADFLEWYLISPQTFKTFSDYRIYRLKEREDLF